MAIKELLNVTYTVKEQDKFVATYNVPNGVNDRCYDFFLERTYPQNTLKTIRRVGSYSNTQTQNRPSKTQPIPLRLT